MIHHRTTQEVRRFDIFKLIVTVVLLLLLLLAFLFRPAQPPTPPATQAAESGLPTGSEAATEPPPTSSLPTEAPAPTPESTLTLEPTPAPEPPVEFSAPTLTAPAAGDVLTAGAQRFSGAGDPDSEVQILINGEEAGQTTAGTDGVWSFETVLDEPGEYELILNALDVDGNVAASSEPIAFTVETPPVEIAAPTLDSPSAGDTLTAGEMSLTGTGTPGSDVEIVINGEIAGTATVGDDGRWSFATTFDDPGDYQVSLNALDAGGDVAASSDAVTFTIEAEETAADTTTGQGTSGATSGQEAGSPVCEEEYIVVADDWLSKLADKYWGDIFLYPAIVTANSQKNTSDDSFTVIDNADLIEPGWKLCIVDADTAVQLAEQ